MGVAQELIDVEASDVSGQKVGTVLDLSPDTSVGELVNGLLKDLELPDNDHEGRPLAYHALLEREARHLHASERVGEALRSGDKIVLQPNIDAGAGRSGC